MRTILTITALMLSAPAMADFIAIGPIQGNVCDGIVFDTCWFEEVHSFKDDGQLYAIGRRYPDVSAYEAEKGRCWIQVKSKGSGLWSSGINAAMQPDFYGREKSGKYVELDVEYLTFKCIKA